MPAVIVLRRIERNESSGASIHTGAGPGTDDLVATCIESRDSSLAQKDMNNERPKFAGRDTKSDYRASRGFGRDERGPIEGRV